MNRKRCGIKEEGQDMGYVRGEKKVRVWVGEP